MLCLYFLESCASCDISEFSCRALGAGQDLKEFDVDNRYGLLALTRILEDCTGKTLHMESVEVRPWESVICRATCMANRGLGSARWLLLRMPQCMQPS